ncbi:hypothetical protein OUZ56_017287 [Daphnia magna]|uniref:Uncharacterized protein n=1 Tax=Daphnia magna TaxID=35525 RepID=A0ABR0ASN0_9CRUS|nr:hypothetical protein OUZ56_017287 [Daphnia magna]
MDGLLRSVRVLQKQIGFGAGMATLAVNSSLNNRPRSDAELPRLNSDLRTEGPRGQIPQVGIQPWQLSIRSWSMVIFLARNRNRVVEPGPGTGSRIWVPVLFGTGLDLFTHE